MSNNKQSMIILLLIVLCGCNSKSQHKLKVTDTIIYYDSMKLINESP